jgi:hypothetical protein
MKCLSIVQPWASLVVLGAKKFETRGWRTSHRGPLAIHASRKFPDAARALCQTEPFRSALLRGGYRTPADLPRGALVGAAELMDCVPTPHVSSVLPSEHPELLFGDYRPGRWAWRLVDPIRLLEPRHYSGRLGIFEIADSLLEVCTEPLEIAS